MFVKCNSVTFSQFICLMMTTRETIFSFQPLLQRCNVDKLQHQRSSGDDPRASGQEITSNQTLQHRALPATLFGDKSPYHSDTCTGTTSWLIASQLWDSYDIHASRQSWMKNSAFVLLTLAFCHSCSIHIEIKKISCQAMLFKTQKKKSNSAFFHIVIKICCMAQPPFWCLVICIFLLSIFCRLKKEHLELDGDKYTKIVIFIYEYGTKVSQISPALLFPPLCKSALCYDQ